MSAFEMMYKETFAEGYAKGCLGSTLYRFLRLEQEDHSQWSKEFCEWIKTNLESCLQDAKGIPEEILRECKQEIQLTYKEWFDKYNCYLTQCAAYPREFQNGLKVYEKEQQEEQFLFVIDEIRRKAMSDQEMREKRSWRKILISSWEEGMERWDGVLVQTSDDRIKNAEQMLKVPNLSVEELYTKGLNQYNNSDDKEKLFRHNNFIVKIRNLEQYIVYQAVFIEPATPWYVVSAANGELIKVLNVDKNGCLDSDELLE